MGRKLPEEAYEHYLELGTERSYQAVADHYGVSKAAVVNRAKRDGWQDRLAKLEREARERTERKTVDEMAAVRERQLKGVRYLQARALEGLRDSPAGQAGRVAQALNIAWKHELLLLGEPTDRQANVEEIIKREYERWMVPVGEDEDANEGEAGEPEPADERPDDEGEGGGSQAVQ